MEVHSSHLSSGWSRAIEWFLIAVVIALFVITFIVQAFQIPSESMENTLLIGDYLLVDKLRYGSGGILDELLPYRQVHRGDIVVFHYPVNPSEHFVKRVIGVPGDRVRLVNRQVLINGKPLPESYVRYVSGQRDPFRDDFPQTNVFVPGLEGSWWLQMRTLVEDGALIIPEGYYFVMGDNRDESSDSRYWGFVPRENIVGRPLVIYWSVREAGDIATAPTASDRLFHLAYTLTHVLRITRWDRTLRRVQ